MPHQGWVELPPSRLDVAIGKRAARAATPARERSLRVITWLADEKLLLGVVGLFWLGARLHPHANKIGQNKIGQNKIGQNKIGQNKIGHEADRMLIGVAIAGVVPHVLKHFVDRKRPNRALVGWPRHGIPRSGDAWDSFPSGHALHLGAIAGPLSRLAAPPLKPLVWTAILGLASTRVMLLAHYASDVAAGLIIGAGIGKAVRKLTE